MFRRNKTEAPASTPTTERAGDAEAHAQTLAAGDPAAYRSATGAVEAFISQWPNLAQAWGGPDGGATTASDQLAEAFAAAAATRAALDKTPGVSARGLFGEQQIFADQQNELGVTKQRVAASWHLRCIAIGLMLYELDGPSPRAEEFKELFLDAAMPG